MSLPIESLPDEAFIPANRVCVLVGGISPMTLWRWLHAGTFPEPDKRVNGRRMWRLGRVREWQSAGE